MKNILLIMSLLIIAGFSCKKNKIEDPVSAPPAQNVEELITTVQLTFTDPDGILPTKTFQFKDVDGAGGNPPAFFDTIRLVQNQNYRVSMKLLNESNNPVIDISAEVLEEAKDHIFCFTPINLSGLSVVRTDSDGVYEIGLQSLWTTTEVTSGKIRVVLKHQPGTKNGTCDPGDTDVELEFEVRVE